MSEHQPDEETHFLRTPTAKILAIRQRLSSIKEDERESFNSSVRQSQASSVNCKLRALMGETSPLVDQDCFNEDSMLLRYSSFSQGGGALADQE